ncbi:MAG TPA: MFS transporter [Solirubrobacteraceae bacterium]|nr:MFS transporter [Solirubrobacteraceae bacterium]
MSSTVTSTSAPSPLRDPKLRRIVAAYTVNRLGTWFGFIALSVAVYEHTHSSIAVAALLVAGQVLPAFVVPALVARVEAASRRGELSALYLFEAAATAALAGLVWRFWLPGILLLVALDGTAALAASALLRAAAARAAREWAYDRHTQTAPAPKNLPAHTYVGQAGIALAVGESGLGAPELDGEDGVDRTRIDPREASALEAERRANAAINIGFAVTFTLGPALAGLAVPAFGAPAALLIDAASFVICGAMLLDLRPHSDDAETSSVRARVRAAWRHINEAPGLRGLLLAEAVALVFFEFSPPIEVAYAKSTLHAGDGGYGLLLGVWGLGVAVGSIVFARSIRRSLGMLLSASTLAVGLAYLGWAIAPSLAVACAAGLIGGVGNGVQWAALISAVQRLTPQNLHGRMMGAVESLGAICPGIGLSLGGAIAALSSPRDAFLVAGVGAALCTIAFVRLPLGSLTGAAPVPVAAGVEPEWASPDSAHSRDSHSSSAQISP